MILDKVMSITPWPYFMLSTTTLDEFPAPDPEEVISKIQLVMEETSSVQVYQALRSPTMKESLNIPTVLWKE